MLVVGDYKGLGARDTRKAHYAHELPVEAIAALEQATFDHLDPKLDDLLQLES